MRVKHDVWASEPRLARHTDDVSFGALTKNMQGSFEMKRVSDSMPEAADVTTRTATRDSSVAVLVLTAFLIPGTLLIPASASGTSVVALIDKTNHRAVIAADCRVNRRSASISECKIIEEPGCTVAIAGLDLEDSTCVQSPKAC
jgi:hypothetical protein